MYNVKELTKTSLKDLRDIAKECGIKGRWDMTKAQLIESILLYQDALQSTLQVQKEKYLKNIEVGVLVAYNSTGDGMKSAKVLNISQADRKLKVVDLFGNIEIIDFKTVTWVKTGKRWPTNIYQMIRRHTWAKRIEKVCETNG